jgi:hypothetical protein
MTWNSKYIQEVNYINLVPEKISFLTKDEKVMIDDINTKLHDINIENKFNDTNLVSKNIEKISHSQSSSFSYLKRCFITLFISMLAIRVNIIKTGLR